MDNYTTETPGDVYPEGQNGVSDNRGFLWNGPVSTFTMPATSDEKLDQILASLNKLTEKVDKLEGRVINVEEKVNNLNDLKDTVEANSDAIGKLDTRCTDQGNEIEKLKMQNLKLTSQLRKISEKELTNESQIRRNNLVFSGIAESTPENCENKIKYLIANTLEIPSDEMCFIGCYRLGPRTLGQTRPILVKFSSYKDRHDVWKSRKKLKDVYINEDFPDEILERRRKLKKILKKAIELKCEAYLTSDKLVIDKKTYTVDTLHTITRPELNPIALSTKRISENAIAFYSGFSPLSNFHEAKFSENNQQFEHVEQYYAFHMALAADNEIAASKVLNTKSSLQCLKLHKALNFDPRDWKDQETVMRTACYLKFSQNPKLKDFLLSTGNCTLIEANASDRYWGVGIGLDETERLKDQATWPGKNRLGVILEETRDRLKGIGFF